jgi:hypothetical protein
MIPFVFLFCIGCGPIGPFSGGRLSGEEQGWPEDWNRVADVTQIQLETGQKDLHSVNLWIVVVDDDAYLATSLLVGTEVPEEREWVRNVSTDPRVRIRVDGDLYLARLETFTDEALRARVFDAFYLKYPQLEESRGEAARYFRITRRATAPMP